MIRRPASRRPPNVERASLLHLLASQETAPSSEEGGKAERREGEAWTFRPFRLRPALLRRCLASRPRRVYRS